MEGEHCACAEQGLNILAGNEATLKLCEDNHLACLSRSALAGGVLVPTPNRAGQADRGGGKDNLRDLKPFGTKPHSSEKGGCKKIGVENMKERDTYRAI